VPLAAGSAAGMAAGAGAAVGAALLAGGVLAGAGPCALAATTENSMTRLQTPRRSERMLSSGKSKRGLEAR
jgi:hypothetical protein